MGDRAAEREQAEYDAIDALREHNGRRRVLAEEMRAIKQQIHRAGLNVTALQRAAKVLDADDPYQHRDEYEALQDMLNRYCAAQQAKKKRGICSAANHDAVQQPEIELGICTAQTIIPQPVTTLNGPAPVQGPPAQGPVATAVVPGAPGGGPAASSDSAMLDIPDYLRRQLPPSLAKYAGEAA